MGLKFRKILGIRICAENIENVLEETRKYLKQFSNSHFQFSKNTLKPLVIFTPNPEIINYAQKDSTFKEIVNSAQINIPDGTGVVWALKKLYNIRIRAIPGVELMEKLCSQAAEKSYTIGLIGGKEGLAVSTAECLQILYPKLIIEVLGEPEVEVQNSEFRIQNSEGIKIETEKYFENLLKEIKRKNIDILFVAFGFPKQEYFINRIQNSEIRNLNKRPLVMMAVGGSFDYIAGRVPRAPLWLRERRLEWLYRLIREPGRIKRQIIGAKFFLQLLFGF